MIPIYGIQSVTTIDYPCKLAGIFFVGGCPWNCTYCYNRSIVEKDGHRFSSDEIDEFLDKRVGFLDGIVISGGEPTMYSNLDDLIKKIKDYGYKVAIHTNGYNPKAIYHIIYKAEIDYIAMDIKAPIDQYDDVTRISYSGTRILDSVNIITGSDIDYEFRTTYHPNLFDEDYLLDIMSMLSNNDADTFYIQKYKTINNDVFPYEDSGLLDAAIEIGKLVFKNFGIRS